MQGSLSTPPATGGISAILYPTSGLSANQKVALSEVLWSHLSNGLKADIFDPAKAAILQQAAAFDAQQAQGAVQANLVEEATTKHQAGQHQQRKIELASVSLAAQIADAEDQRRLLDQTNNASANTAKLANNRAATATAAAAAAYSSRTGTSLPPILSPSASERRVRSRSCSNSPLRLSPRAATSGCSASVTATESTAAFSVSTSVGGSPIPRHSLLSLHYGADAGSSLWPLRAWSSCHQGISPCPPTPAFVLVAHMLRTTVYALEGRTLPEIDQALLANEFSKNTFGDGVLDSCANDLVASHRQGHQT